jgi:3-oxoacyl-[acyl-carrier protein] reductase
MEFINQVVIVTGAGSKHGIGKEISKHFGIEGATVILADINFPEVCEAAEDLGKNVENGTFIPIELDVTNQDQVRSMAKEVYEKFGSIDVLVNNAGIARPTKILDIEEKEWDVMFDVNVKGLFFLTKEVIKYMKDKQYGRIVNISSVAGKRGGGVFGGAHYASSKAAVMGLTKAVAREMAGYGITCNCVVPGFVDTDITAGQMSDEKLKELIEKNIPVGRKGNVSDIARTVKFLSSKEASYITGEDIDVNGGLHID